jgi:hypothetical protein
MIEWMVDKIEMTEFLFNQPYLVGSFIFNVGDAAEYGFVDRGGKI